MTFFAWFILILVTICMIGGPIYLIFQTITKTEYLKLRCKAEFSIGARFGKFAGVNSKTPIRTNEGSEEYDVLQYLQKHIDEVERASRLIGEKRLFIKSLEDFLRSNSFQTHRLYNRLRKEIEQILKSVDESYIVEVKYPSGRSSYVRIDEETLKQIKRDSSSVTLF